MACMHGSASITINASLDDVYAVLSDVTRIGEFSPECYACEWNTDSVKAVRGSTFTGHNRLDGVEWSTHCEITTADPGRLLVFGAGDPGIPYTRWIYALEPDGVGTKVIESFEILAIPPPMKDDAEEEVAQRIVDLIEDMRQTLARMKETIEGA